jgi:hypothetical protein
MRRAINCGLALLWAFAFACGPDLRAQDSVSGATAASDPADAAAISVPSSTRPSALVPAAAPAVLPPLTFGGRFEDYLFRAYGPLTLLGAGFSAGVAELRNDPSPWGRGGSAFGRRYASLAGRNAISQTIQFGLGALDGEDPRYHRSLRHGFWGRGWDAAVQALVPYKVNGTRTFAFSRVGGWFGSGLISNYWYPAGVDTTGDGMVRGATMIASDVGTNMFREFWPDVKRKYLRRKIGSPKP